MKTKIYTLLIVGGLFLAACAPAPVMEAEPVVAEQPTEAVVAPEPTADSADAAAPTEAVMAAEVSFSKDIWPVIESFALKAHGGKGGVFLESYEDIMKYVVPGDPKASMLYKRLTADGVAQMPPSGPLPAETVQLFYDWIMQGAKNN
jgi:hypothetical protein